MKLSIKQLEYFINNLTEYRKGNLKGQCPNCGKKEFYISYTEENHPFQCYRKNKCGYKGNIFTLIFDQKKFEFLPSNNDIGEYEPTKLLEHIKDNNLDINIDLSFEKLKIPLGFKKINSHEYLDNRCFYSYHKYEIGITKLDPKLKNDYVIFLIKQNDETVAYIGRHIKPKNELDKMNETRQEQGLKPIPRYRNSLTDFSKILLGIDECNEETETVIIVEGLFDKDRVDLLLSLDEQNAVKCCATNGSKIHYEQIQLLQQKGIRKLIVLYEADVLDKIQENISEISIFFESISLGFVDENDPGDMNSEELELILLNLKSYSTFFETKVKIKRF